jgi:hypothetical protein
MKERVAETTMAAKLVSASASSFTSLGESFASTDSEISDDDSYTDCDDESDGSSSCGSLDDDEELLMILARASENNITTNPVLQVSSSGEMRRSTSLPSLREAEMSTMQVSVMLNQLRSSDQAKKATRRHSHTSNITRLEHIQGEGMNSSDVSTKSNCILDATEVFNNILTESGFDSRSISHSELDNYFLEITESRLSSYSMDVIHAVRNGDLDFLRKLHIEQKLDMNCCNRFGESIVHMACRHAQVDVVRFLIMEANATLRVVDDFGRNPCHDAAWQAEPNVELIHLIVTHEPDLLLISDKRGFTPLQYVRKGQLPAWVEVLQENRANVLPRKLLQPRKSFSQQ